MYQELSDHFVVAAGVEATWAFFSAAENLAAITPPSLGFTMVSKAGPIERDSILDYTIRWMGIPIRWRTRIIDWSPMRQFIDLQIRGPYALWHHQHTFEPVEGGVACRDRVTFQLPVMGVRRLVQPIVRKQLVDIFRFRREAIGRLLGEVRPLQGNVEVHTL